MRTDLDALLPTHYSRRQTAWVPALAAVYVASGIALTACSAGALAPGFALGALSALLMVLVVWWGMRTEVGVLAPMVAFAAAGTPVMLAGVDPVAMYLVLFVSAAGLSLFVGAMLSPLLVALRASRTSGCATDPGDLAISALLAALVAQVGILVTVAMSGRLEYLPGQFLGQLLLSAVVATVAVREDLRLRRALRSLVAGRSPEWRAVAVAPEEYPGAVRLSWLQRSWRDAPPSGGEWVALVPVEDPLAAAYRGSELPAMPRVLVPTALPAVGARLLGLLSILLATNVVVVRAGLLYWEVERTFVAPHPAAVSDAGPQRAPVASVPSWQVMSVAADPSSRVCAGPPR